MKHKFLVVLLAIVATLCMAFGLSACGEESGKEPEKEQADLWSMERVYASAQELGFKGTLEELIAMFKGEKGDPGQDGKDGRDGIDGQDGKDGKDGIDGQDGQDGKDGIDGQNGIDGLGIQSLEIDENGHLKVTLSDGTVKDLGKITAESEPPAAEGTEGLQYQIRKDEEGNEYAAVIGLGMAWDRDIVIPSTFRGLPVKEIGQYAFYGSYDPRVWTLTSVSIPDSVTKIDSWAFLCCSGLTSVTIGSGVTSIVNGAFGFCSKLAEINVDPDNQTYHAQNNCLIETGSKTLVVGCKTSIIPNDGGVTAIGSEAFRGCSELTSIDIPDKITSIGNYAFYHCYELTSVIIPDGVTSIGANAFVECWRLQEVYFKNPNGWKASYYPDMSDAGTVSGLEDPATAAEYLGYYDYYWKRED